jgi:hypothetical protein
VVTAGTVNVDLVLAPAGVTDVVTVRSQIAPVASSATLTALVDADLVQRLPSANRHALQFAHLAPGVDAFAGAGQVIGQDGSNAVVANGQRSTQNSFYLDGAENSGAWRNWALQFPNPDTVQEIQVQRSNVTAQYGRQPGAVVNVVTRSGTNRFQGTAFHFFHDERLNANLWVNNRNGFTKPEDNLRHTGGSAGWAAAPKPDVLLWLRESLPHGGAGDPDRRTLSDGGAQGRRLFRGPGLRGGRWARHPVRDQGPRDWRIPRQAHPGVDGESRVRRLGSPPPDSQRLLRPGSASVRTAAPSTSIC